MVFGNRLLRKVTGVRNKCMMKRFIFCTLHHTLLGWESQKIRDQLGQYRPRYEDKTEIDFNPLKHNDYHMYHML
jgi:hypothetical protein